jgi:hypothetical protein
MPRLGRPTVAIVGRPARLHREVPGVRAKGPFAHRSRVMLASRLRVDRRTCDGVALPAVGIAAITLVRKVREANPGLCWASSGSPFRGARLG